MNDYDNRQYQIMLKKIEAYKQQKLYISELIGDLEALLKVLEERDEEWEQDFMDNWVELEITYATMLYLDRHFFNNEEEKIINEAVDNLEKLVKFKLEAINKDEKVF